jgi:hypothetical protein
LFGFYAFFLPPLGVRKISINWLALVLTPIYAQHKNQKLRFYNLLPLLVLTPIGVKTKAYVKP